MDVGFSDYIVGGMAVSLVVYNLYKVRRNSYKLAYKDVIMTAGYLGYATVAIGGSFNDGTILGFLASVGISFIVASIGLTVTETVVLLRIKRGQSLDCAATIDKSIRWVIIAVIAMYMTNVAYDGFMQDGGTRVDLLFADTIGLCLAVFCLERARQQLRVASSRAITKSA